MVHLDSQEVIQDHLVHLTLMVDLLQLDTLVLPDSHHTMDHQDHLAWDLDHRWCHCHRGKEVVWDHQGELRDQLDHHLRDLNQPRKRKDWQIRYCHRK